MYQIGTKRPPHLPLVFSGRDRVARFIAREVLPRMPRGFTVDPRWVTLPSFGEDDYLVSLHGHEQRFAATPDEAAVADWLQTRMGLLSLPWWYVGGWHDSTHNWFCLDVSFIVKGRAAAYSAGAVNRQQTIFWPCQNRVLVVETSAQNGLPMAAEGIAEGAMRGLQNARCAM